LRASSTIIYSLERGCEFLVPVKTIKEAFAGKLDDSYLICGERRCKKIKGFDLGNSPSEVLSRNIKGKKILITTTNGIKTILKCASEQVTIICGFLNNKAVVEYLSYNSEDINIICAGSNKRPALEDVFCGGEVIHRLKKKKKCTLNDSAIIAESLYLHHKSNIRGLIINSRHAMNLKRLGYSSDIDLCLKQDISKIVPFYSNKIITNSR